MGKCAADASECLVVKPVEPGGVTALQLRQMENEKRSLLRDIRATDRSVRGGRGAADLRAKLVGLKGKIEAFKPKDAASYEDLQSFRADMDDIRDAYEDAVENGSVRGGGLSDEQLLRQMKTGVRSFERFIGTIETKVKRIERGGIVVDTAFKELLQRARTMVDVVKAAKTYDEVQDVANGMAEVGESLNEYFPKLELLSRIPRVLPAITRQLAEARRLVQQSDAVAKRLGIDAGGTVEEMNSLLDEIQAAVASIKSGEIDTDDLGAYIDENITEKLTQIRTTANTLRAMANLRQHVAGIGKALTLLDRRLRQSEAKDIDVSAARGLYEEAIQQYEEVKALAASKVTPEVAEQALDYLAVINDLRIQIEDAMNLPSSDASETQLRRLLESGGESFQEVNLERLGL